MQWASKVGRREEGEEGSAWLARVGAPRTASAVLNGRPLQSVHALLPPFSSLFSTILYSYCVEDCEECDPHVGEDSFPEGCLSEA